MAEDQTYAPGRVQPPISGCPGRRCCPNASVPSPVPPLLGLGHRRRLVRHGLRSGAGTRWHRFGWRWGWHHDLRRRRRLEPRQKLRAKGISLDGQCRPRSGHLYQVVTNGHVGKHREDGEEPAAIDHCPITVLATPLHARPTHRRDGRVRGGEGIVRGLDGLRDMGLHSNLPCGRVMDPPGSEGRSSRTLRRPVPPTSCCSHTDGPFVFPVRPSPRPRAPLGRWSARLRATPCRARHSGARRYRGPGEPRSSALQVDHTVPSQKHRARALGG